MLIGGRTAKTGIDALGSASSHYNVSYNINNGTVHIESWAFNGRYFNRVFHATGHCPGYFWWKRCRGVGIIVDVNDVKLFFVLIQGLPEETSNITVRYYSNKTSYMYEAQSALTFLAAGVHGTVENPKIPELTQLK